MRNITSKFINLMNIFILGLVLTACANQGLDKTEQAAAPDDQTYAKLENQQDKRSDRLSWK